MILLRTAGLLAGLLLPSLGIRTGPRAGPDTAQRHHRAGPEDNRHALGTKALGGADRAQCQGRHAFRRHAGPERRSPSAILFASRPVRGAGHMSTADLMALWSTGSFAKDPPNATVSAFAKDGTQGHRRGRGPEVGAHAKPTRPSSTSPCWKATLAMSTARPRCSSTRSGSAWARDGFNYIGRSADHRRHGAPAIGSREDTSTFSGWSNPAPSATGGTPVFRSSRQRGGYGYAPPPPDAYQTNPPCGKPPLLPCY